MEKIFSLFFTISYKAGDPTKKKGYELFVPYLTSVPKFSSLGLKYSISLILTIGLSKFFESRLRDVRYLLASLFARISLTLRSISPLNWENLTTAK